MSEVRGKAGRVIEEMKNQETGKEIPHKMGIYEKYIKRPQDFLCALVAIIVLSPVMLITALLVRAKLGSPVIFTQDRPGLEGKIFKLYKFRSMTDARDENGDLLPDEVRLTSFGKKLRSTSLDELPELFNMLKGDMSVVGDGVIIGINKKNLYLCGFAAIESSFFFRLF